MSPLVVWFLMRPQPEPNPLRGRNHSDGDGFPLNACDVNTEVAVHMLSTQPSTTKQEPTLATAGYPQLAVVMVIRVPNWPQ